MNIFVIGDVVGSIGCNALRSKLPSYRKLKAIDFVIANGENSADGNGILPTSANHLFDSGVDVITTGNHVYRRKEIYDMLDTNDYIIRPANFPPSANGKGVCVIDTCKVRICVINIMGTAYMEALRCPFETMDEILKQYDDCRIKIVDFHAEATAEKRAMGFYLDGKVSAVYGTHTHVLTADATVLPNGTGYVTDIGMTGPVNSVLGVKPELAINKFRTKMPVRFENADGQCKINGAIFDIDEKTGKTRSAETVEILL